MYFFLYKAMRELKQRPKEVSAAATRNDIEQWRAELDAFLLDQADAETRKELEKKTSDKWQRLATFDLTCGTDWQLKVLSGYGLNMYSNLHEHFKISTRDSNKLENGVIHT